MQLERAYAAARQRPEDAEAVGKLGMLLDLYHRPSEAMICFQRAQQIQPRAFRWPYFRGSLLLDQKNYADAVAVLTSALRLRPGYLAARLKLGEALIGAGKIEDAGKIYAGILSDSPDTPEAYYGLGRVEAARGDQNAAAEKYRKACELFRTYGAAHYGLATSYRRLGRISEAEVETQAYERNRYIVPPVDDPLRDELRDLDLSAADHLDRGAELEQVGRIDDAIAETERALQLDPSLVKAHVNLLILYARTGNVKKAEEHYRAVLSLDPDRFPDAHYSYGIMLMGLHRDRDAEEAFRRAIRASSCSSLAHNDLGLLLEHENKIQEAESEYRLAAACDPNNRQAHYNFGRILVNEMKYKEAIEELLKTITPEDEATPAYLYALGAAYGRAGDRENAVRYLREAREKASERGQSQLLGFIEKDLETLKAQ